MPSGRLSTFIFICMPSGRLSTSNPELFSWESNPLTTRLPCTLLHVCLICFLHSFLHGVADGSGTSLWVQMWSGCVALVPSSLVVHIPSSVYSRLVRELQQGVTASHSWPCTATPPWAYPRGCQSASATCYHHPIPCHWPSACACDLRSGDGCERAELEKQACLLLENLAATETARSKSSLSMAEGVTIRVRPKRDQNRPPWRYWRRTPESQHRKPGEEVKSLLTHLFPPP